MLDRVPIFFGLLCLWLWLVLPGAVLQEGTKDTLVRRVTRSMFGVAVVVAAYLLGGVVLTLLYYTVFAILPYEPRGRLDTTEVVVCAGLIFALTLAGGTWLRLSARSLLGAAVLLQLAVFCLVGVGTGFHVPTFYWWFGFLSLTVAAPHYAGVLGLVVFRAASARFGRGTRPRERRSACG